MNLGPVLTLAISSFAKDVLKRSLPKVEIQGLPSKIRLHYKRATFPQTFDVEESLSFSLQTFERSLERGERVTLFLSQDICYLSQIICLLGHVLVITQLF